MMRLLICLVILACNCAPAVAFACDNSSEATPDSACVVLDREGVKGVWFRLDRADELRRVHLEVPELRLQIKGLEQRGAARDFQLKNYREVVQLKQQSIDKAMANMGAFAKQAREAREGEQDAMDALHAWYRSPVLWAGIGAGIVVGIVVALAVATRETDM